MDLEVSKAQFGFFTSEDFFKSVLFVLLWFFYVFFYIVSKGVKNGIEKLNVWMMPSLFILLILMLVYAISKDGFMMAVKFLFVPDFSKINTSNVLEALGLAFF